MSRKVTFKLVQEGGGGGTTSLTVAENIAWPDFVVEAERATGAASMKYKYIDSDGDEVNMDTPEELEEAIRWMTRKGSQAVLRDAPVVVMADQDGGGRHCSDGCDKQEEEEEEERLQNESGFSESRIAGSRVSRPVYTLPPCNVPATTRSQEAVGPTWLVEALEQLKKDVRLLRAESERQVQHGNAPLSGVHHDGVLCDYCGSAVVGVRYKCGMCANYDLCEACEQLSEEIHLPGHAFIKLRQHSSVAGLTSAGHLVPLLVGSPYEILPDVALPPHQPFDEATTGRDTAGREIACRRLAGVADRLRRKLEKIDTKLSRSELRRSKLQGRQMRLRESLGKIVAAAESGRCDASGSDGNVRQEFEPVKCVGKKLDKMHHIGKAVKREKLLDKSKHGCRRALSEAACRDEPQPSVAVAAAAEAAASLSSDDAAAPEPFRWHRPGSRGVGCPRVRGFRATCESAETFPDGTKLAGGSRFVQQWMLHNNGLVAWDKRTTLKMAFGCIPCSVDEVALPPLAPGERAVVRVEFDAPSEEGIYRSMWLPCNRGRRFGQELWCQVRVVARAACGGGNESKTVDERCANDPLRAATIVPERSASETDNRAASVAVVAATEAADPATEAVPKPCEAGRAETTEPKAGASVASSLEAACDLMHLKMLASSQTATPNNTPLAMSPPKSPEPFAVRTRLASASRRGRSLVAHTAFEAWEHAAESGEKSDHTCSRVDESDSEDDCCYDDDFVVVPVPPCFNLKVPYVHRTVEVPDASPSDAAGGHAAMLPVCGVVSPTTAEVPTAGSDLTESCSSAVVSLAAGDGSAALSATAVSTVEAAAGDTPDMAIVSVGPEQTAIELPSATASSDRASEPPIKAAVGCAVSAPATSASITEEQSAIELPSEAVPPGDSAARLCETGDGECRFEGPAAERDEANLASSPVETQRSRSAGFSGLLTKARDFLGEILKSADQAYTEGSAASVPTSAHQSAGEQHLLEHDAADSPTAAHLQHFAGAAYDENVTILYPPESPLEQLVSMGFANRPLNMALLQKHNGDIEAVLRELLNELDNDWHARRH